MCARREFSTVVARGVFGARAAVVDFFVSKGPTVPCDAPDWLATRTKGRVTIADA